MANPGSMLGMCIAGADVRASHAPPGSSKFRYRIEAVKIGSVWIGCNTMLANKIVSTLLHKSALAEMGLIPRYDSFRQEVREGKTRFDFVTTSQEPNRTTFIEVKTVTMASNWYDIEVEHKRADKPFHRFPNSRPAECNHQHNEPLLALFPDCESTRAQKHVEHLAHCASREGTAGVMIFVVVRDDVSAVSPSEYCDAIYSKLMQQYLGKSISCIALQCKMRLDDPKNSFVEFLREIPVYSSPDQFSPTVTQSSPRSKRGRIT
jgi:DNA-binding sugar fermentation-stimulating protein